MDTIKSFTTVHHTMDDDSMDTYSGYSPNERYRNYMQIVNTLKFFENNGHITEDWMEEHKSIIELWRDWIDDYSTINPEFTDKGFRKACCETETLISYLIRSIRTTKTFDTKVYYILVNKMKYICDSIFVDDEMEDLMSSMSLK
jgi:hypothetical protein